MVEPGPIFERLHSEFFAALEACRAEPQEKPVHRLRTTARRMEALLNTVKRRRNGGAELAGQIDRALRALKPIRRAAGCVRDTDVQRKLLEEALAARAAGGSAEEAKVVAEQGQKLFAALTKSRASAAKELLASIEEGEEKVLRRLSLLHDAICTIKWSSLLKDARAVERQSARGLKAVDAESMHAYRKGSKAARYLAEMEEGSVAAARYAKRVKQVLDAIGAWHDWMLLTALAKKRLGKSSALAMMVKKETERALRKAVRGVERLHRG